MVDDFLKKSNLIPRGTSLIDLWRWPRWTKLITACVGDGRFGEPGSLHGCRQNAGTTMWNTLPLTSASVDPLPPAELWLCYITLWSSLLSDPRWTKKQPNYGLMIPSDSLSAWGKPILLLYYQSQCQDYRPKDPYPNLWVQKSQPVGCGVLNN